MMLCDLSCDQEATGSNSHGGVGGGGDIINHVLTSPLFAPAATLLPQPEPEERKAKKKRSQPGNPDPEAEVVALSPRTLVATNRFVCEVCNKGFQRDQNLQLHRRGHNLPWKLRQRAPAPLASSAAAPPVPPRKRVYVCPEPTCVHHHPERALGDLTGIKKHFSRKHGEKRWRCDRCGKRYAVHSDWKAHVKNCGTREYRCDCGILFSRKDSLLTHRAFCDALAEESARLLAAANNCSTITTTTATCNNSNSNNNPLITTSSSSSSPLFLPFGSPPAQNPNPNPLLFMSQEPQLFPPFHPLPYLDDLLIAGSNSVAGDAADTVSFGLTPEGSMTLHHAGGHRLTRDFLGVDDAGEVEDLQVPLCAAAAASQGCSTATVPRAACCATDLTRQYLGGGRLPPVNETWSHNF